ncbi:rRNA biogenesis protein RRP5 [Quercus suber]|uniref:rRNA biogenesis protein RRP5 n=1 Tax=Quercus suber TaxID=58331 RepID=UPI0032DE6EFB
MLSPANHNEFPNLELHGLGNLRTGKELGNMIWAKDPSVVLLAETLVDESRLDTVQRSIDYEHKWVVLKEGRGGGLILFWKSTVNLEVVDSSQYYIDTWIDRGSEHEWRFTGDFNELTRQEEKLGGAIRQHRQMQLFREVIDECGFLDLGFVGKTCYMTIKINMSKAYDRVEWVYLENVMRKMGFSEKWIGLIMVLICCDSVSFKQAGALEDPVFTHSDVKPGMVVRAKIIAVDSFGAIVQFPGGVKALCPVQHMSEFEIAKPGKKFKVGAELVFRVLGCKSKRITVTHKKTLVKSKLGILSSYADATDGLITHGWITKIERHGCFIRFYNGVQGFAPRSELGLEPGCDPSTMYHVGQVVKCRITSSLPASRRINLSFIIKPSRVSEEDMVKLGSLISAVVDRVTTNGVIVYVNAKGYSRGTIPTEHLADHHGHATLMKSVLKPGYEFDQLLVLDISGNNLVLSAKHSLINLAEQLPLDISQIHHNTVIHGYICNLIETGCFVRFLGRLTGFSPRNKATDDQRVELSESFYIGQSVRSNILDANTESGRITVSLKQSSCYSTDASFIQEYFLLDEKKFFPPCWTFLEANHGEEPLCQQYVRTGSFNQAYWESGYDSKGMSVIATVMALPSPSTSGRLLLLLKSMSEASETSSSKRAKKKSSYKVGSLVQAEITEIKSLELKLKFGIGFHGRVHITEVNDDNVLEDPFSNFRIGQTVTARIVSKANRSDKRNYQWELSLKPKMLTGSSDIGDKLMTEDVDFSIGQCITGYVFKVDSEWVWVAISRDVRAQLFILDSACEPSELKEFQKRFQVGKAVSGHVLSINKEKKLLRLVLSPFALSKGHVNREDLEVDNHVNEKCGAHINEGDIVGGRVSKILSGVGGLIVQIGPQLYGRVHYTELTESLVPDPLSGYHEGQFVKCKVLEVSRSVKGTTHVDLSLRFSLDGTPSQSSAEISNTLHPACKHVEQIEELHPNMVVQGYVKNVTSKGCFILLSRKIDAKILLSNLSDGFVDNPEKDFPVGKLLIGRVLSVEPLSKRVEVTLKTLGASRARKSEINDLRTLHVGDIISGRIKRIESYGLFITIDNTNLVGLCHVSELSNDHIDNIETKYRVGESVTAKILKVDEQRHRISLGMKNAYIEDNDDIELPSKQESDEATRENGSIDDTRLVTFPGSSLIGLQNMDIEGENGDCLVLAQVESRASIPPLEVSLDDIDQPDMDNLVSSNQAQIDEADTINEKNKRRPKKKAKEEREQEIRAAEERLLENDIPRTADEFEKLVRSSPNSSFVWIKYMAFMLSMADVEKARSIAERALQIINIREENEKLNIWVAYFNLENEYGNPPEEAVRKVFQRALQYNDPKKVHLALLGMYERTEQHKLTDELLDKMVKKYKHSCKVWLRRVQRILKQTQDAIQPVVNRALLSLPRHKHIKFISQTAILEFKCGVPDRGRSMFEGILREYPKRTDLWSIYLDQEIRLGDADVIRALFERAISLSLPTKKMKFFFKKYLEYEKSHGDEERIESVKRKAMEYVESTLA